jgi:ectoine hydroxylase-related dioxygenase (phytanoyl-CoA dioxygenase family)
MDALSPSDRARLRQAFFDQGYVVIERAVHPDKLADLGKKIVDEFERARTGEGLMPGGGLLAGHINCFPGEGARFAYEAVRDSGIIDLIRDVYPRPFGVPWVNCNLNLPNSVVQHYHVDSGYLQDFMIANVAVVDTTIENGAIEVAPGTHKKFYKFWRFAVERPHRHARRLSMRSGDVLIRTSRLWHRGMPNLSRSPRPMLAMTFTEDTTKVDHDPFTAHGGRVKFLENWYRPTKLGRLRERAYLAAPFTYDAYRFVRSMFGDKGYTTA